MDEAAYHRLQHIPVIGYSNTSWDEPRADISIKKGMSFFDKGQIAAEEERNAQSLSNDVFGELHSQRTARRLKASQQPSTRDDSSEKHMGLFGKGSGKTHFDFGLLLTSDNPTNNTSNFNMGATEQAKIHEAAAEQQQLLVDTKLVPKATGNSRVISDDIRDDEDEGQVNEEHDSGGALEVPQTEGGAEQGTLQEQLDKYRNERIEHEAYVQGLRDRRDTAANLKNMRTIFGKRIKKARLGMEKYRIIKSVGVPPWDKRLTETVLLVLMYCPARHTRNYEDNFD
ncbi:hypothetical protein TI39_contig4283g00002 [Zymoseptoria brevis]|uniref:Uncharacterized protein n=1 Tax=Zymoseptoria brevis TaxID=1047168 RepID=A0A0F4GBQ3_9PEZI|nr:hypothetical protein TI39_contig4283g00002 [Zymoseptoria brevis]